MMIAHVFDIDVSGYEFKDLPKGMAIEFSINAYTGKVFVKIAKQAASVEVAERVIRDFMRGLDAYGRGSDERSMSTLLDDCDGSNWDELTSARPCHVVAFERGDDDAREAETGQCA